jgi:hypothetical protein
MNHTNLLPGLLAVGICLIVLWFWIQEKTFTRMTLTAEESQKRTIAEWFRSLHQAQCEPESVKSQIGFAA